MLLRAEALLLASAAVSLECVSCIIALKSVTVVGMYELKFFDFNLNDKSRCVADCVYDFLNILDFMWVSTLVYQCYTLEANR